MGLFTPTNGAVGIFDPRMCGQGTQVLLSFVRQAAVVQHRAPTQSLGGEVLTSWVGIGTFLLDVQPVPAGFSRLIEGLIVKVDVKAYGMGFVDLQEGDRCYGPDGHQLEITNVLHFGSDHTALEFREVGR